MSDQIFIFDTTLRDGEQSPGASLNVGEKVEIARQLTRLGVDVIEAGFPVSSPGDFEAVQKIVEAVGNAATVCALTRAVRKDIDVAWDAVKAAPRPRIHTGLGVSESHLTHKLRKTKDEALEMGVGAVRYARMLGCPDVEYFTEDAGRAEPAYLYRVIEAVIDAGATVINVPDTTGYTTPDEYGALIAGIFAHVPNINRAIVSAHCHNDLGMATANALAAVRAGARQVECTINGIGERAGNTSLEEVVMALRTRRDIFAVHTNIVTTEIYKTSRLVSNLTGILVQPNKAIVGANAFAHSSGIHQDGVLKERTTYEILDPRDVGIMESKIVLSPRSGRAGVRHRLTELGILFDSDDQFEKVYRRFLTVADRKKIVYDEDLEALASDEARTGGTSQVYELVQLQVTCGDQALPTATVKLRHENRAILMDADTGNGPVDAVYRAINRIVGVPNELIEIALQSVTEGTDAQAEVTIRVRSGDDIFTGRAAHTDIIVASTRAYLNALNKLIGKQSEKNAQSDGKRGAERNGDRVNRKNLVIPASVNDFHDYFLLDAGTHDILADFGYELTNSASPLPRFQGEINAVQSLQDRLKWALCHLEMEKDRVVREFFIAPVLLDVLPQTNTKVSVGYEIEAGANLKGVLDYVLEGRENLVVVYAKQGDLMRGMRQLAASLVAVDQAMENDFERLYGAIAIGTVWQFTVLNRTTKKVAVEVDVFRVPADLHDLARTLIGILDGEPAANAA